MALNRVDAKSFEVIMVVPRMILLAALIFAVSPSNAQDKPILDKPPARRSVAASGKETYAQYCSSCHGVDARGNGPAAIALKTPPPDLTTLAKRHDGKFPYKYVSEVLRFGTRIVSHGSSDMPVWGPVFGAMENSDENALRKRIKDLSDYLASLQEKES